MAIMCFGESQAGPIEYRHIQSTFTCSQHAPADTLAKPYEEIARIVTKAMQSVQKFTLVDGGEYRPYTDDEIRKQIKLMLLSMQGSWTTQHHYSWKVQTRPTTRTAKAEFTCGARIRTTPGASCADRRR